MESAAASAAVGRTGTAAAGRPAAAAGAGLVRGLSESGYSSSPTIPHASKPFLTPPEPFLTPRYMYYIWIQASRFGLKLNPDPDPIT